MMAVFEKSERLRHIGHLDIMRSTQRALRRSGLKVSYSKGFNPHILITFASALSTGSVGLNEIMDVTLDECVEPDVFLTAMNAAMPPDMQLKSAKALDDKHPALMSMVCAASYDIRLLDDACAATCMAAIPAFMQQEAIPAMRKTKSGLKEVDIKPLIYAIEGQGNHLRATLMLTESMSCKPDMLVKALCTFAGCEVPRTLVIRQGLLGEDEQGNRVPLETL